MPTGVIGYGDSPKIIDGIRYEIMPGFTRPMPRRAREIGQRVLKKDSAIRASLYGGFGDLSD